MDHERLSAMICTIASGGAKSMVRVSGYSDRGPELDAPAHGISIVGLLAYACLEQAEQRRPGGRQHGTVVTPAT
jgi:hypothetical protein